MLTFSDIAQYPETDSGLRAKLARAIFYLKMLDYKHSLALTLEII
ncbi:hypothetical protein [Candidatus Endolissoclinum faulkneri]|nr:hypothetical protein [Candidatus Endolissoclinum faulkneri]